MAVNKSEVRKYQDAMAKIERRAKSDFYNELLTFDWQKATIIDDLLELVGRYFSTYGELAAELGRQFYQFCVDNEVTDRRTYTATSNYDYENTRGPIENQVEYYVERMQRGEIEEQDLLNSLSMTLGDYVNRENRKVILDNLDAEEDWLEDDSRQDDGSYVSNRETSSRPPKYAIQKKGVAYVRVPTSGCACAFCMMMASRGAVYWSEERAGGTPSSKYHDHCRCTVVRVSTSEPFVEGFDETEYYDMYSNARRALYDGDLPPKVYERIDKAKARHDKLYREGKFDTPWRDINEIEIAMRYMYGLEH